jgi:hypothetical protein
MVNVRSSSRMGGTVLRNLGRYRFIKCPEIPEDVYYKSSDFRGSPPLADGEEISFEVRIYEGNKYSAVEISRRTEGDSASTSDTGVTRLERGVPNHYHIFDWAFCGLPTPLYHLKELALDERWEFQDASNDPATPFPILHSYLIHTFGRLVLEGKVLVDSTKSWAAFNTGLVDDRYEPIHALFEPNDDPRTPWQLKGFCIPGEDSLGQNLVRYFSPLPSGAHYFDNPVDLLYDARVGKPELDWRHIIIENIDRYPIEFLDDHWPRGFTKQNPVDMDRDERETYYTQLGGAIENDNRIYRQIMNRVKDAVDLSIKRVTWNFKTAIPQYYPRVEKLQILLPVCLISDEKVDLALAVEKTVSGNYLGHTVLTLDWAYKSARLICRPDSDWLTPGSITQNSFVVDSQI